MTGSDRRSPGACPLIYQNKHLILKELLLICVMFLYMLHRRLLGVHHAQDQTDDIARQD